LVSTTTRPPSFRCGHHRAWLVQSGGHGAGQARACRLQVVVGSSWPGVRDVTVTLTAQPSSPGSGGSTGQINVKTATQNLYK
jgi:hypothetical protein